jgi:drug/metabolite transporter (DMT)-like permease
MKYTLASTASVLNQTSAIFTLILATVFLRERLTVRKSLAILMGFAGGAIAVL